MQRLILINFFFISLISSFVIAENKLSIAQYIEIPNELKTLKFKPDIINWSARNSFLLLDSYKSDLISINSSGNFSFAKGLGKRYNVFGELIWAGISSNGILVVDRLENEVIILDINLNFIYKNKINLNLYPEMAQIDPWGKLFLYSNTYNGIFIFEKTYISKEPFIDFSKEFYSSYCINDFSINDNGDLAILGCDGKFSEFSQNGLKKKTIPLKISEPLFLIPFKNDWLIFNSKGESLSITNLGKVSLPKIRSTILDVTALDKSIDILTKEKILVLNVR